MTAKNALKKSIEHWVENCIQAEKKRRHFINTSYSICACCQEFRKGIGKHCEGCPIKKISGYDYCKNTPYYYLTTKRIKGSLLNKCILELEYLITVWYAMHYKGDPI